MGFMAFPFVITFHGFLLVMAARLLVTVLGPSIDSRILPKLRGDSLLSRTLCDLWRIGKRYRITWR